MSLGLHTGNLDHNEKEIGYALPAKLSATIHV